MTKLQIENSPGVDNKTSELLKRGFSSLLSVFNFEETDFSSRSLFLTLNLLFTYRE